jgi:hypothetical protein
MSVAAKKTKRSDSRRRVPTYHQLALARKSQRPVLLDLQLPEASIIFYWDPIKLQFIDPSNVQADSSISATGTYTLDAKIFSFHSSAADMGNLFKNNANNVQVTFSAQTQQDGEDYTWLVTAALSTASQYMGGSDGQSVAVGSSANQLTKYPTPQDQIAIENGTVTLTFGLAAQKKASWWDTFLSAIGAISNSPLFAVVPMAKLASQTVEAVTQMTAQIESQEKLNQILEGSPIECSITAANPSQKPFAMRSGFWLMANYDQIKPYIDNANSENLQKNIFLDIPSQQYDVVDKNALDANNDYLPIDVTYAILWIDLAAKSTS